MRCRVKEVRMRRGMTLAELSKTSGVPISTIGAIEKGVVPRVDTAIMLARALGIAVEKIWLLR